MTKRIILTATAMLFMTACTASDVITTATALIVVEVTAAQASGWQPGVVYGDAALVAVSCIGKEYASADTAALKAIAMAACATTATITVPSGNAEENVILSAIDAALDGVLAAYGVIPPSPAMFAAARAHGRQVPALLVRLHDGSPNYFTRHSVLRSAAAALAARK